MTSTLSCSAIDSGRTGLQPSNHPREARSAGRILVVDDDLLIRKGLSRCLTRAGFEVHTAADGMEAITLFDEEGADLIVLDVNMPGMDGFEACDTIKRLSDVPVIFLTGAEDQMVLDYLAEMTEAAGGDYFLRKPCDARVLIKLIDSVLKN